MEIDVAIADLVRANRILSRHQVLDGYGHVSIRNPADPERYHISRDIAPGLVTIADVMTFDLDSRQSCTDMRSSYVERFIHGEIYKRRRDVHAVVHCHSPDLVAFAAVKTPLRTIYHMAGAALAGGTARFEIRDHHPDSSDMLVRSGPLGAALADVLGEHAVVLMRGHGATVVAPTIRQVVFRAIYAQTNARVQAQAMLLGDPKFLSDEEARLANIGEGGVERAWALWCHEDS
jgi:HCOMODA/2-hydroxy-3-carboxy-muconic semialdehyde decarboxylase